MTVTDSNFETEVEQYQGTVMVDFGSVGCGPCRMIAPLIEELAAEMADRIKIVKMDVDDSPEVAVRMGITSIPCLILFKNGKEVDRVVGARSKDRFKTWIESKL
ncbi:MAG: thioredoxin [Planctomycetota bacterium]